MTNAIISFNVHQADTQVPCLWACHSNILAEQNEVEGLLLSSLSIRLKYNKLKEEKNKEKAFLREEKDGKNGWQDRRKNLTKSYKIWKDRISNRLQRKFLNSCVHCEKLEMLACLSCTGLLPDDGTEVSKELRPKGCKIISHKERYCQKYSCSRVYPISTTILLTW